MALLAQISQAERIMTLGKAYALFIADEVAMKIGGNAEPERPNQEQLPGGGF